MPNGIDIDFLSIRVEEKKKDFKARWEDFQKATNREYELPEILEHFKKITEIRAEHARLKEDNEQKRAVLRDLQVEIDSLESRLSDLRTRKHLPIVQERYQRVGLA